MFQAAEAGNKLSREEFERLVPDLRRDLVNAQTDLKDRPWSVLIMVMGNDGPGCEELLDRLHEWMDARFMDTRVFDQWTDEERARPRFWRYWRALPAHGRIGLFMGAWAVNAIADIATGRISEDDFDHRLDHVRRFEQQLADDGTLLLKFWLHMPRRQIKKRLKKAKKNPDKAWRMDETDWKVCENYDELIPIAERFVRETGGWMVVESTDREYRDITVANLIREGLQRRLAQEDPPPPPAALPRFSGKPALDTVDLATTLESQEYKERLEDAQSRLRRLVAKADRKGVSTVLAFEGWDAAGKGGTIRRITRAIPARYYNVIPVAAPTDEERAHHYLWRFWRRLPRAGRMVIFDRTWYGRVLVERVEGLATEDEWKRAYAEIADFEEQIVERGCALAKFWLHIDPEEQLRRFCAREQTEYKKYKITDEDYRNRERWDDYVAAINEMVARTSTDEAPWHLVASNDKRVARVQVVKAVCGALERAL